MKLYARYCYETKSTSLTYWGIHKKGTLSYNIILNTLPEAGSSFRQLPLFQ